MEHLDVELFIDAIEKRPSLWDSSSGDYKNRQLKRDDWKEVCEIVIQKFGEKDEKERQEIGREVQLKWKSLRDAYVRTIRQSKGKKSGASAKAVKTYIYAKQLGFLRKVTGSRQTESSLPSTSREGQEDMDVSKDINDMQSTSSDVQHTQFDSQMETGRTPSRSTLYRRKKSDLESKLASYIDSHNRQPALAIQSQPQETDDMAFFRSLQASLDTLTPNEKLNFRIEVMQLLSRYTNKQPNQYIHNFPNHIPHYQPQQYPVMTNISNIRFNTPAPPFASYSTVSSEITPHLPHPNTDTTESLAVTSPQTPFSPTESENSIISQAESLISLLSNQ
ncbi:unnamed protein product [Acanthoscelides obtectus]|uniref:MADF domain-containing protein n=1 Tax=Acanthoscelides obtectus TaxID=200917 RepID=A0A9P0KWW2_ACAOB|nr:unnamed protein product [Acanthoscelides obtectus]CAH1997209.1 unnamed protein product [Acanthoscelides obtectus]CAK1642299.1 hypothetical protein AOBTE_LOCUS12964 [Acanthoscelides obtectus]CAK1681217.1 hypothetical protein AOBTE_LOCUS33066 [Acanthoscelides obtectus]